MLNTDLDGKDHSRDPSEPMEQRSANRIALLIRSAKLTCEYGEFLCIIRDLSDNGVKLQLFHGLPDCTAFTLELANRETFGIVPVWQRDGQAGFKFASDVDIRRILQERNQFPKRPVRLNLKERAIIVVGGQSCAAEICDISREGLRITTDYPLAIAQKLRISSSHFSSLDAVVRWRDFTQYGLVLPGVLSFKELAQLAARIQLPRSLAGPDPALRIQNRRA